MSFANDVKQEICSRKPGAPHCRLAEAAAILVNNGSLTATGSGVSLEIGTDRYLTAVRMRQLLEQTFHCRMQVAVRAGHKVTRKRYLLRLSDPQIVDRILKALKLEGASGKLFEQDIPADQTLLKHNCCRRAFLAGSFLCCGTMSTPEKHYHLEYVLSGSRRAEQLAELMASFDLAPGVVCRKKNYIVYIKEGRQVSDMLNIMQATVSLLEYENIRIKREIRGNVNRKVNCEAANINKTVAAAVNQIRDIELIRDTVGLESLAKELYDTARMRLEHPDAALGALGALMDPPVGKSGMNHRFQKLKKLAEEIALKQ